MNFRCLVRGTRSLRMKRSRGVSSRIILLSGLDAVERDWSWILAGVSSLRFDSFDGFDGRSYQRPRSTINISRIPALSFSGMGLPGMLLPCSQLLFPGEKGAQYHPKVTRTFSILQSSTVSLYNHIFWSNSQARNPSINHLHYTILFSFRRPFIQAPLRITATPARHTKDRTPCFQRFSASSPSPSSSSPTHQVHASPSCPRARPSNPPRHHPPPSPLQPATPSTAPSASAPPPSGS